MNFIPTTLEGAWLIEVDPREDERGFFARTWCEREFAEHGISMRVVQCSVSFNRRRGTLRGMHYQAAPHPEAKIVRCTRGAIHDVILDLRPASPTFKRWFAAELNAENHRMLFVPEGFAHGLQTVKDDTEVFYMMSEFFHPDLARGVRWNDPAFGIEWPLAEPILSERDRTLPSFNSP